ncbi:MAG: hypothetical protein IJ389_03200 [Clostridia bacterium]|nr:hypothetical protein [Clostridia bacterium]
MRDALSVIAEQARLGDITETSLRKSLVHFRNRPVVIVNENILYGVPKSKWVDTVKNTISTKFSGGIPIGGRLIKVNYHTRNEFTESKNTKHYRDNQRIVYKDKLKSANNLDEIVLASTNYINEDLNHKRNDNFVQFARGDVLMRIGTHDYEAKVIVGFTSGNQMVLYDVIDFDKSIFKIKKVDAGAVQSHSAKNNGNNASTNNKVPPKPQFVNPSDGISSENPSTDDDSRSSKRIDYGESDRAIIANALESVAETAELHGCCDLNTIAI